MVAMLAKRGENDATSETISTQLSKRAATGSDVKSLPQRRSRSLAILTGKKSAHCFYRSPPAGSMARKSLIVTTEQTPDAKFDY